MWLFEKQKIVYPTLNLEKHVGFFVEIAITYRPTVYFRSGNIIKRIKYNQFCISNKRQHNFVVTNTFLIFVEKYVYYKTFS